MQRKQILRFLIPIYSVVAMSTLSTVVGQKLGEAVTKNGVRDYTLITIALGGFFSVWIFYLLDSC